MQEILAKYQHIGETHPLYKKLQEAVVHGQDSVIKEAIAEIEALQNQAARPPSASKPHKKSFPLWNLLWILLLAATISGAALIYVNKNAQRIRDLNPRIIRTSTFVPGPHLAGSKSSDLSIEIVNALDKINPENVLFVGHQLAKREIVEHLSQLAKKSQVLVAIGKSPSGKSQFADQDSPLRKYQFTVRCEIYETVHSQVLLAFNNQTKQALCFIGTFPYDTTEAEASENMLILIRDYQQCSDIYNYYIQYLKTVRTGAF